MGSKHICLPFASEAQYREYVDDPAQDRQYLSAMVRQYRLSDSNGEILGVKESSCRIAATVAGPSVSVPPQC